jgi:pimeloyl-ACP methyl ester carboxylesterase
MVHGAANSAVVWTYWQHELARLGYASYAIDLRGHGDSTPADLSNTTMADYASDVRDLVGQMARPPVIVGWSMGGLVALMAAAPGGVAACICLEPSPPALELDESLPLRSGVFGAEEYGIAGAGPQDQPSMPDLDLKERAVALSSLGPESRRARDERKRGIVVGPLACPVLLVAGTGAGNKAVGPDDALFPGADYCEATGASHWGLVLSRRTLAKMVPVVLRWLVAQDLNNSLHGGSR